MEEYVLLSMIPGVDGQRKLLVISRLGPTSTQSGAQFLPESGHLRKLMTGLRKRAPEHRGPWRFQAILRTEGRDNVPANTELVALRGLPE